VTLGGSSGSFRSRFFAVVSNYFNRHFLFF
jgi:hypothetical protein